jgi:hypothetical protein
VLHDAAAEAPALIGRGVDPVPAAAQPATRLPHVGAERLHLEHIAQESGTRGRIRGVGAHAVEALQRVLAGHVGRLADQGRVGRAHDRQAVAQALVV